MANNIWPRILSIATVTPQRRNSGYWVDYVSVMLEKGFWRSLLQTPAGRALYEAGKTVARDSYELKQQAASAHIAGLETQLKREMQLVQDIARKLVDSDRALDDAETRLATLRWLLSAQHKQQPLAVRRKRTTQRRIRKRQRVNSWQRRNARKRHRSASTRI